MWWRSCQGHALAWRSASLTRATPHIESNCKAKGKKPLTTSANRRVAPTFHSHSQWTLRSGARSDASLRRCDLDDGLLPGSSNRDQGSRAVTCTAASADRNPYAASVRLLYNGSYTSPVTQRWCSKTESFRATAATALFFALRPPRSAIFKPHRRRSQSGPKWPRM